MRKSLTRASVRERLRSLGEIVLGRVSAAFPEKKVLNALVDPEREKDFWQLLRR